MELNQELNSLSIGVHTRIFLHDDYERIDNYLSKAFPFYSRSFWQRAIKDERVHINQKVIKSSALLKINDTITINLEKEKTTLADIVSIVFPPVFDEIKIIDTQEHFIIIEKPAGIIVHKPSPYCTTLTLVDWLITKMPECGTVGHPERPGIVHRLDKDTSGLMIIARTHYGHHRISTLFKDRAVKKTYHAFVTGHPDMQGTIDISIGRNPQKRNQMTTQGIKARDAVTAFKVDKYFDTYTLLSLYPHTGRTHQIRVHCTSIGHPLIGDAVYGLQSSLINRHALHAYSLAFNLDGFCFSYTIAMPADMQCLVR